ncbi:hypothetical protein D9756_010691 [Leucocoprinus leucothites]|uniref:DUF6534 domain-containing protein n=1 Tax=Leucocoprinus leucothites TaxID=201217 RepID=A0A8H5CVR9_9AGAR|nr:hypothetical protein D9756_010691 [Leucoagaricus leucothites]
MSHATDLDLTPTHGVLLIGVLFATFFQGVLTVQVYQYYQDFPDDPRRIKILVAALWILGLIQLVLVSYTIYYYLVVNWGNVQVLKQKIFPLSLYLFFVALSILFSHLFLLYRIWIFSQRSVWIVGPVFVCCLGTFGLIFAGATSILIGFQFPGDMSGSVVTATVTDVLIAALLCYYLRKRSEGTRDMKVTSTLVAQVTSYTVATSALTSLIMLASVFSYIAAPRASIAMALYFSSGPTYANAVLMNLNARSKIRETLENMEPSFAKTIELGGSSSAIRRLPRHGTSTREHLSRFTTSPSRPVTREITVPLNAYPPRNFRHSLP